MLKSSHKSEAIFAASAAIKAAEEVYTSLGSGHDEAIYRNAMICALRQISARQEVSVPIYFLDYCVGTGRADIVLPHVIVELKTVAKLNDSHRAQLRAYMRFSGKKMGVLINFPLDGVEIHYETVDQFAET